MAAEPKTRPTDVPVPEYLATVEPEQRRKDAEALDALMRRVTGEKPVMWGPSIVGYGATRYTNARGGGVDWPLIGFAARKANLVLYIALGFAEHAELLDRLGKHTTGKGCLYINRLTDVSLPVLEELVAQSMLAAKEFKGANRA